MYVLQIIGPPGPLGPHGPPGPMVSLKKQLLANFGTSRNSKNHTCIHDVHDHTHKILASGGL